MSLRAAGSSFLSCSRLCTHMRRCSPPSTLSLILTDFQLSIGFGPLLAMPHPDGSPFPFLFSTSQDSLPSRTQPPSPVQSSPRDSWLRTSIETQLPARLHTSHRSSCRHVLVARMVESDGENSLGEGEADWERGIPPRKVGGGWAGDRETGC